MHLVYVYAFVVLRHVEALLLDRNVIAVFEGWWQATSLDYPVVREDDPTGTPIATGLSVTVHNRAVALYTLMYFHRMLGNLSVIGV